MRHSKNTMPVIQEQLQQEPEKLQQHAKERKQDIDELTADDVFDALPYKERIKALQKLRKESIEEKIPLRTRIAVVLIITLSLLWYFVWFLIGSILCFTILFIPIGIALIGFGQIGFFVALILREKLYQKATQK